MDTEKPLRPSDKMLTDRFATVLHIKQWCDERFGDSWMLIVVPVSGGLNYTLYPGDGNDRSLSQNFTDLQLRLPEFASAIEDMLLDWENILKEEQSEGERVEGFWVNNEDWRRFIAVAKAGRIPFKEEEVPDLADRVHAVKMKPDDYETVTKKMEYGSEKGVNSE